MSRAVFLAQTAPGEPLAPTPVMTGRTSRADPGAREAHAAMTRKLADTSHSGIGRPAEDARASELERSVPSSPTAISLWIDDYDDIFSDFDPRPFSQRALSEDFLAEVKRAVRDRREGVPELRFLVPAPVRNLAGEATIRKRLREHFRRHAERLGRVHRRIVWTGVAIAAAGFGVMTTSALLRGQPGAFWWTLLNVVLEPSGWFAVWFGLDRLCYGVRDIAHEREFYRKMGKAEVVFVAYVEEVVPSVPAGRIGVTGGSG
jgi:hypothetical protein